MTENANRAVWVTGIGQTPVGEHWNLSLRDLAAQAAFAALRDAELDKFTSRDTQPVDAVIVGNMLSGVLSRQENLGALIAETIGLCGIEAWKVEGACASGGAAIRAGYSLIASGLCKRVLVVGVEKMTDVPTEVATAGLAMASDADHEALHGLSFTAIGALLTQAYSEAYGYKRNDFAPLPINAHRKAFANPYAMFHKAINEADYLASPLVASPLGVLDCAPICDGAAAIVLSAQQPQNNRPAVRLAGSASATDTVALARRRELLWLNAAERSSREAMAMANLSIEDISFFELHDAFPVMAALSLESVGYAKRGEGIKIANTSNSIPIQTMGGLKGRGHLVGATGIYQAVEACLQLRGEAGANQIPPLAPA